MISTAQSSGRPPRGQRRAARARERRRQVADLAEVPLLDGTRRLTGRPPAGDHDALRRACDRGHAREDVRADRARRVERGVVGRRRRCVAVDAVQDQLVLADPGHGQRRGRALTLDLERGRLERGALGRRHAEEGEDVLEGRARPHGAEDGVVPFHGVPADAEAAVDRPADGLRRDGRRGLHERLRGAARVEHVALGGRARADRRSEVVVAADGQHGAASRLERRSRHGPSACPRRRRRASGRQERRPRRAHPARPAPWRGRRTRSATRARAPRSGRRRSRARSIPRR